MKDMKFVIDINASKEKVWQTLWEDKTLRQWAGIIDPGTYMVGELKQGNEVEFISGGGYGVTSLVEQITDNKYLMLRHQADTQDTGQQEREKQWTGGTETYSLTERDGRTTLTIAFDVPDELEDMFSISYPKAMEKIKELAENN